MKKEKGCLLPWLHEPRRKATPWAPVKKLYPRQMFLGQQLFMWILSMSQEVAASQPDLWLILHS